MPQLIWHTMHLLQRRSAASLPDRICLLHEKKKKKKNSVGRTASVGYVTCDQDDGVQFVLGLLSLEMSLKMLISNERYR